MHEDGPQAASASVKSQGTARRGEASAFDRPLDRILCALRFCEYEYRPTPAPPQDAHERIYATCPRCRQHGCLTLEIIERGEGAEVELACWSGCTEESIRRALAAELVQGAADELQEAA